VCVCLLFVHVGGVRCVFMWHVFVCVCVYVAFVNECVVFMLYVCVCLFVCEGVYFCVLYMLFL